MCNLFLCVTHHKYEVKGCRYCILLEFLIWMWKEAFTYVLAPCLYFSGSVLGGRKKRVTLWRKQLNIRLLNTHTFFFRLASQLFNLNWIMTGSSCSITWFQYSGCMKLPTISFNSHNQFESFFKWDLFRQWRKSSSQI